MINEWGRVRVPKFMFSNLHRRSIYFSEAFENLLGLERSLCLGKVSSRALLYGSKLPVGTNAIGC